MIILLHINNTTYSFKLKRKINAFCLKKDRKKLKPYLTNMNIYLRLKNHENQWISYFRDNLKRLLTDQINCGTVKEEKLNPDL